MIDDIRRKSRPDHLVITFESNEDASVGAISNDNPPETY